MDFQYDNPVRQVPGSPFSLAGLGKELNFQVDSNPLKRDWPASPSRAPPVFSWTTPQQPQHQQQQQQQQQHVGSTQTRGVQHSQLSQHRGGSLGIGLEDTPQTDDAGVDTVSEQDSPVQRLDASHHGTKPRRSKLSDIARLKLRRQREKRRLRDALSDDDDYDNHDRYGRHNDRRGRDDGDGRRITSTTPHTAGASWSLDAHRDLPYIASGYLQLGFNLFVLGVVLYFIVVFIQTVQSDVGKKVEEYSAEILAEISQCSKEYLENRCSPDQRVPAMQMACQAWERCMERDPGTVGRARVSAETFAEIVNALIEPISYKTMAFCALLLFGSLAISNAAFGLVRSSSSSSRHQRDLMHHGAGGDGGPIQPATFMIQATPHRSKDR